MKAYKVLRQHNQRLITLPKSFKGKVRRTAIENNTIIVFSKVPDGTTGDNIFRVFPQGIYGQCKATLPAGTMGYYLQIVSQDGNSVTYRKIQEMENMIPPKSAEGIYKEKQNYQRASQSNR